MNPPVTMRQIAQRAKVSIGTVSHVINDTATVREKLRERVLEAIRSLGYQPSQLARGLRRNQTSMLVMIIPDVTNPFFPAVIRGVEDVAYKSSLRLVLCNTDNDPRKELSYLNEMRAYRPAGWLVIPSVDSEIANHFRADAGPPVVCLDRQPSGWRGDVALVANEEGAYKATCHLLRMGHRQLAVITGPLHLANAVERLEGFKRALAEAKVHLEPDYIQEARFERESGYQAAIRLLRMLPRPTGIFACNDLMALGVFLAARELGLRCPEDVSIVGFDNLDFAEFTAPALTTVHQPGYQLGTAAARLLLERMNGSTHPAKKIVLPSELKIRNSVATVSEAHFSPSRKALQPL
ncbi:MAG TPA: LacI family DNA-binding transcriptional regulator [Candidatus Sulfotelmatobacter sp.]|nr:LacI family DNA-binding transcriptional regulator [Candidatus Sulfotelmatobacter sp.]